MNIVGLSRVSLTNGREQRATTEEGERGSGSGKDGNYTFTWPFVLLLQSHQLANGTKARADQSGERRTRVSGLRCAARLPLPSYRKIIYNCAGNNNSGRHLTAKKQYATICKHFSPDYLAPHYSPAAIQSQLTRQMPGAQCVLSLTHKSQVLISFLSHLLLLRCPVALRFGAVLPCW